MAMLHETTRINLLETRREAQLLNIMFMLKSNNLYRKECSRVTCSAERYIFDTEIVHMDVYARGPYYKGVALWNNLPIDLQKEKIGLSFKVNLKRHLGIYIEHNYQSIYL